VWLKIFWIRGCRISQKRAPSDRRSSDPLLALYTLFNIVIFINCMNIYYIIIELWARCGCGTFVRFARRYSVPVYSRHFAVNYNTAPRNNIRKLDFDHPLPHPPTNDIYRQRDDDNIIIYLNFAAAVFDA